jgi:5'-methylthioadenosine phosphorylase
MDSTSQPTTLIYGGTAAYWLHLAEFGAVGETLTLETPFGPAAPVTWLTSRGGLTVGFSSRHGVGELQRSAGFVNHRANLWAAQQLGFQAILSWNGVGAINPALAARRSRLPALRLRSNWATRRSRS